jgi:hypothetical protein
LQDLEADWEEHGKAALQQAREKDPVAYVRVVAGLLPRDVKITHTVIDEIEAMTDEEILERLEPLCAVRGGEFE